MKYPAIEGRLQKLETTSHPMTLRVEKHPEAPRYYEDIYIGDRFDRRLIGISLDDL